MKPEFEQVVKDYIKLLYFFARRSTKKDEVDDIVGNTFLKAYKAYENFHYISKNQLKCWLLTICQNTVKDSYKTKMPVTMNYEQMDQIGGLQETEDLLETVIQKDQENEIFEKLKCLDPADQELIKLRILEDLSFKEIAEIFFITESAAKMRFYRTVSSLRNKT